MTRHLVRFGLYLVIGYSLFGVALTAQSPSKEYIRVNGRVIAIENTASGATGPVWWNNSWTKRRKLTILKTQVAGPLTDFPVAVVISDTVLAGVAQASGSDIAFTTEAGLKLNHEIESYNNGTGALTAWVKVPSLSNANDTVLYLYYGNGGATDQQNKLAVWNPKFKSVHHWKSGALAEDAALTSTLTSVAGLQSSTGKLSNGMANNGGNNYAQLNSSAITFPPSGQTLTTFSLTLSTWFKTSNPGGLFGMTDGPTPGGSANGYVPALYLDSSGKLRGSLLWTSSDSNQVLENVVRNDDNWHFAVITIQGGMASLFVDGQLAGTLPGLTQYGFSNNGYKYFAGAARVLGWPSAATAPNGWSNLNGSMDETRILNEALTPNWIRTEFNNQNAPSQFYTLGSAESGGTGGVGGTVTISGATSNLAPYTTRSFSASVSGVPVGQDSVRWSVVGVPPTSSSNGLISTGTTCVAPPAAMTYRAPSTITTAGNIVLKAESCSNPSLSSSISIPVAAASSVSLTLTPTPATIPSGATQQFTATVANADIAGVTWSPANSAAGTLNQSGMFTATPGYTGSASVRATSNDNANIFFDHPFNVGSGGSVTISGATTNLAPYTTRAFTANVSGLPAGQDTVRWSVLSAPATSSNGLISTGTTCVAPPATMTYRAPSTITTAGNIVLKAESCSNTSLSATIMIPVAIASSVTVTMSPKPASIAVSQQFAATVSNADGNGVNWTLTPTNAGTLSASGLFNRASGFSGNATVKATSAENLNAFDSHPFNIPAVVSISLTSSAPSQSIISSATANFPITYTSTGTTGQVFFSFVNLPAGANFNINPSSVTNQGTASITASVSPSTSAAGVYNFVFRATNGTLTQDLPLTLSIVDCGTITVSPSSVSVFPFQMANFTATRGGAAANFGVTWTRDTPAGSFSSQLDPPAVPNPQISYYAADPSTQPQTVVVTARTNNPNTACQAFGGTATVTKQTYVPNGLSLLYTNPLATVAPLNFSRFFDYGAASQNGAGTVRFIQLELRNNLGEVYDPASACAVNFNTTTNNNDPGALTLYAWANVSSSAAGGGSTNTNIAPRGGSASSFVTSTTSCELDGIGSDYVRSGNIFALHMKVKMKSAVFSPGTIHVYVRSYGMDLYEPAIRQYMGSFTATN